jgi:peptidoglycan/xylan/chitin deacetylase (PgdA/CDA1 family)
VDPNTFLKQIEFLEKSYQFSDTEGLIGYIDQKYEILKDHVLITFDDGYADNYRNALPILKKKSYPALVFLIGDKVGSDVNFLNVRQIKEMLNNKFEFGSHTLSHVRTSSVDEKELENEIVNSKIQLEQTVKINIDSFAFPKGKRRDIHPLAERYIKKAGYKAAFTTENGVIQKRCNRYDLNRLGIRECPMFVFKVRTSGIFEGHFSILTKRLPAIINYRR